MNKAYKLIKRKVKVSPNIRKTIDLNAEVYSQDIDVTKIILVLEDDNGEKIDLTDADVRVALQFNNVVIEDRGKVESIEEQSISYSPGERFKYQEGLVTIAFYVTLSTNQRIDISHFKINFKRSLIDSQRAAEDLKTQFVSVNDFIEKEKKSYEKSRLGFNSIVDHTMDEIMERKKEFDLKMQELQEKIALPDLPSSNSKLYVAYMKSGSVFYKTDTGEFDYAKCFDSELIGISFSNSDNEEDYIWFPAMGAFADVSNQMTDEIGNLNLHVAYRVPKSMDDPLGDTIFKKAAPDDPPSQAMYSNYVGVSLKDSYKEEDYVWFPSFGLISRMINQITSGYTELLSDAQNRMTALEEKLGSAPGDNASTKRPPYGYRLNRKADPWELIFDNGCILTFPLDTSHNYYGWNETALKAYVSSSRKSYVVYPYSTPEIIMWHVKGHYTVDKIKEDPVSNYKEFINCELKKPINDSSLYNFDNAFGDASDDTLIGKRNFVKLLYELDALVEDDLLSVGVTKNKDR